MMTLNPSSEQLDAMDQTIQKAEALLEDAESSGFDATLVSTDLLTNLLKHVSSYYMHLITVDGPDEDIQDLDGLLPIDPDPLTE